MIELIIESIRKFAPKARVFMTNNYKFGHISSNVLMLIGVHKFNELEKILLEFSFIHHCELVNSYVNIFLKDNCLNMLNIKPNIGKGIKTSIEFGSPNITGPMHIGILRGITIGYAIYRLLKVVAYDATIEMFFNDKGNQVDELCKSILYYKNEENGQLFYKGSYVKDMAKLDFHVEENCKKKCKLLGICQDKVMDYQSKEIFTVLKKIVPELQLENVTSERFLQIEPAIKELDNLGLVYEGKLEDNGPVHLLFKSTQFGDDKDRVLERDTHRQKDEEEKFFDYTYFAADIAYHYQKKQRQYSRQIIVLSEDHKGHFLKLKASLKALGIHIEIITHKLVNVFKGEEFIKLSKREGVMVELAKSLDNLYALRCNILALDNETTINLQMDKIDTNSLFLIQYVTKKLNTLKLDNYVIEEDIEKEIFHKIISWNFVITTAVNSLDPHVIYEYTLQGAKLCQKYWSTSQKGNNYVLSYLKDIMNTSTYILGL
jgi:arginyl-tRNA synthetase